MTKRLALRQPPVAPAEPKESWWVLQEAQQNRAIFYQTVHDHAFAQSSTATYGEQSKRPRPPKPRGI
jgi:hypothetical protein